MPEQWFSSEVNNFLFQNNIRRKLVNSPEELDQVNQEKALSIYKERFANAGDFTFFLVGNFEVDEMEKWVSQYLASLPGSDSKESWQDPNVPLPSGKIVKDFKKGQEPKSVVRLRYHGKMKWTDKDRINIQALSSALNIMLTKSLREDKGGVYTPGVRANYQENPTPYYNLQVFFSCAPENVDDLIQTTYADVQSLRKKGPTEKFFKK